jgi:hypothetical protein
VQVKRGYPYYELQEMRRLEHLVQDLNTELYNPVGLNIRWPRKVAFLFVSALHCRIAPFLAQPDPYSSRSSTT